MSVSFSVSRFVRIARRPPSGGGKIFTVYSSPHGRKEAATKEMSGEKNDRHFEHLIRYFLCGEKYPSMQ